MWMRMGQDNISAWSNRHYPNFHFLVLSNEDKHTKKIDMNNRKRKVRKRDIERMRAVEKVDRKTTKKLTV